MTAPVPEERNDVEDLTEQPPGEHSSELPGPEDDQSGTDLQEENAGTTQDQPSQ